MTIQRVLNQTKALRTLRKNALLVTHLVGGLTQEQAEQWRDGADGWRIIDIICHLRDMEPLFRARVEDTVNQPGAIFRTRDQNEMAAEAAAVPQDLQAALAEFQAGRAAHIAMLEGLTDEQWLLTGAHPQQGPATVLEIAVNTGLHDVDHLEQILHCLP
jgi:hypothetical protein